MCLLYRIILPGNTIDEQRLTVHGSNRTNVERIIQSVELLSGNQILVDTESYRQLYGFDLSQSEICNYLAHRQAWQQFVESESEWCLVVESCIELNVNMDDVLDTTGEFPANWDFFFPYDLDKKQQTVYGNNLFNRNTWEYSKPESYLLEYKFGNSIYLLSRAGAQKMLQINAITDRLDHTIINNIEFLKVFFSAVEWFDARKEKNYEWPERSRLMLKSAIMRGSWTDERLNKARNLLQTLSNIGINLNINLVLDAGTLLAHVRHGGIMLWDDDFDIGIEEKDVDIFFKKVGKYPHLRYSDQFRFYGKRFFKIWDMEGETIDKHIHTFPFVDVWVFNEQDNDVVYENGNIYREIANEGYKDVVFEGSVFKIPKNPAKVLDSRYSDWRTTVRVYTWVHRLERNGFKYLCIPIETDENGRIKDICLSG